MYNRYVRNDQGTYHRLPQEETTPRHSTSPPRREAQQTSSHRETWDEVHTEKREQHQEQRQETRERPAELRFLNSLLDKIHLSDIDAGDLILLALLFLLFREDGDEELLIALGLLLIL